MNMLKTIGNFLGKKKFHFPVVFKKVIWMQKVIQHLIFYNIIVYNIQITQIEFVSEKQYIKRSDVAASKLFHFMYRELQET
jgi:hypothetical protein